MAYRFPTNDQFTPPQYRYRPTIPRNHQETRPVLYSGARPYQAREVAYHGARSGPYPAFQEDSYSARETLYQPIPREGYYPTFLETPYETVREGSYAPEGPYQSLLEGTFQSLYEQVPYPLQGPSRPSPHLLGHRSIQPLPAPQVQVQRVLDSTHPSMNDLLQPDNSITSFVDGACPSLDDILASPNVQQPGSSRPSPHSIVHRSSQPPSAPQPQAEKISDSTHQSLNDLLQSDNSFHSFIDGAFESGDEMIAGSEVQRPEVDFQELDLGLPSSIGGPVEDRADSTALALMGRPPNPVRRQCGEYGDLKVFLEELSKTMNRKLDKMANGWADFANDVTMKGQADDEWKDTIEQRLEDHTNQQVTDMETITEKTTEMERNHPTKAAEDAGEDRPAFGEA